MKSMIIGMVKDCKADCYIGQPMFFDDEFQASRAIEAFNNQYNKAQKHDFQMYKVGEFDKELDKPIVSCEPELMARYIDDEVDDE